jgi:hypothetical protein
MSNKLELHEVFTVSGIPKVTFTKPEEYPQLLMALKTPGRCIIVEGPSGIGKTTAVTKAMNEVGIADQIIKLSARKRDDVALIKELPTMQPLGTVLIDDFHKLPDADKKQIADLMKVLADEGQAESKIIAIGINRAGEALIAFADDLTNRLETIQFEANPDKRIFELIRLGENALNVEINIKDEIVEASHGSFYIAQMLAYQTCLDAGLLEAQEPKVTTSISFPEVKARVFETLSRRFQTRTQEFAKGTRLRREGRAPYLHLLYWLGTSEEWTLSLDKAQVRHPDFKGSLTQIIEKDYLIELLRSVPHIGDVVHYEARNHLLTVEDPQFVFYLRNIAWDRFAEDVGYLGIKFPARYDFALSFAGLDREIAKAIFANLEEREVEVFYDKNEQHRILAEDVEDYLRPIYQSDAEFVVVLLGKEYPKRIWTKFESDQFKTRFKKSGVIPIWFSDAPPGLFDESGRVGGITYDVSGELETQVAEICELLSKKITESRVRPDGEHRVTGREGRIGDRPRRTVRQPAPFTV